MVLELSNNRSKNDTFRTMLRLGGGLMVGICLIFEIAILPATLREQERFQELAYNNINDEPTIRSIKTTASTTTTTNNKYTSSSSSYRRPLNYNETFGKELLASSLLFSSSSSSKNSNNTTTTTTTTTTTIPPLHHNTNVTKPPPEHLWLITPVPFPEYNRTATLETWKANPIKKKQKILPTNSSTMNHHHHQASSTGGTTVTSTSTTSTTTRHVAEDDDDVVIPRVIHKVILSKVGVFPYFDKEPKGIKNAHDSWMIQNPGYEMKYYDLNTARGYLQTHFHPIFLRAFDCIEAFAGKANLFRFAVIYREGGWYSDWKEECMVKGLLEDILAPRNDLVFFMDRGLKVSEHREFVMTGFIGGTPRHPFWAAALKRVLIHVQGEYYGDRTPTQNTGPGMLGMVRRELIKTGQLSEESVRFIGSYRANKFYSDQDPERIYIMHKCKACGNQRAWGSDGNLYTELHNERNYYCQDARSLFSTTMTTTTTTTLA